ncbi:MAG: polysaccharide biosynthesis C-terminal domain-containing protein, partial [Saprospiraceae bacterium]
MGERLFRIEFISSAIGAVISILLARLWGTYWQGQWSILQNFVMTCALIFTAGLPPVIVASIRKNKIQEKKIFRQMIGYFLILWLVATILFMIATHYPALHVFLSDLTFTKGGFLVIGSQIAILVLINMLAAWMDGKNKLIQISRIRLVLNMIMGIAILVLYIMLAEKPDLFIQYTWYAFIVQAAVLTVLMMKSLSNQHRIDPDHLPDQMSLIGLIRNTGWVFLLAELFQKLNYRIDIWFLAAFTSSEQIGVYSISSAISLFILIRSRNSQRALINSFKVSEQQFNRDLIKSEILLLVKSMMGLMVLFIMASFILFHFFLDSTYQEGFYILIPLTIGIFFISVTMPISAYFTYNNWPHFNLFAAAIGLICNIILNSLLIPQWGIWGAAWASLFTY